MEQARRRTASTSTTLAAPPAIWRAFQVQGAWKSWALVALLGIATIEGVAVVRLAGRPPEFVLVDSDGTTTFVKRAVATEPLLQFLAERTRPPELAIVRFTREFLQLALGIHSATVEANWPAALALMSPPLRERVEREADAAKLVETYRASQQRTELGFESVTLVARTSTMLQVRAVMSRARRSLVDREAQPVRDRIGVDLALGIVQASLSHPDGLEVVEWSVEKLAESGQSTTGPVSEAAHVR